MGKERERKAGAWAPSSQAEEGRVTVLVIRVPYKISLGKKCYIFLKKKKNE